MFSSLSSTLQGLTVVEALSSVSVLCIYLIIINFGRFYNGMKCLLGLILSSAGLIYGILAVQQGQSWESLVICWGIFGAIARFSLAGTLIMGVSGWPMGCLVTIILGFILCPITWLQIVFSVLLLCFTSTPKRSLSGIAIALAAYFGLTYAPTQVNINQTLEYLKNIHYNDYSTHNYDNRTFNNRFTQIIEEIKNYNKNYSQPIAYAITISGVGESEQTLAAGCSYTMPQLSPACGSHLEIPDELKNTVVFSVEAGKNTLACTLKQGDYRFKISSSGGSTGGGAIALPGSVITITYNDMSVCQFRVDSVLYLDKEGRSCSQSAGILHRGLFHLLKS